MRYTTSAKTQNLLYVSLVLLSVYRLTGVLQVRTRGYEAIQDVSEAEPKWVKRNVDVLVQLLQTGECERECFKVGRLKLSR
jgi:hypothetical protein